MIKRCRTPGLVLFLALSVVLAPAAQATPPEGAKSHIETLGQQAISTLQRADIGLAEREALFAGVLEQGFALQLIGRFVLGKYWRTATPEQKADYQRLFTRFVIKTYAARIGGFSGTTFKVTKTVPVGEEDVLVTTQIDRPSGAPLVAGWRVRLIEGQHKIIDVMVEGISMAATQRQEFSSVVKSRGLAGLLEILRARTQTLAASG